MTQRWLPAAECWYCGWIEDVQACSECGREACKDHHRLQHEQECRTMEKHSGKDDLRTEADDDEFTSKR